MARRRLRVFIRGSIPSRGGGRCRLAYRPRNASLWGARPAGAAAAPLQPAVIDLSAVTFDGLPPANPATPNLRSKALVITDGATAAVQMGTVFKHYHSGANEIQLIVGGSGTEWLGDRQVPLTAGTLVIIPKGTAHGGLTDNGNLKIFSIKTPPQDPADTHPLP